MAILLSDLRTAFQTAVDSVITTVSTPVADVPVAISPNEEFTFSVTAANTGADAVRLISVIYHVQIEPSNRGQLKVPPVLVARASPDATAPTLVPNTFVSSQMYLFPANDTLDVNQLVTLNGLKGKALALGAITLKCHVHCDPDLGYMFPGDEKNSDGIRVFTIV